ncbi:hypothetical protein [Streptomyces atratus]|uniref:hypothetical protein n=1 Tax=Streptomyces atratus TaxID=1893 RepID=UPI0018E4E7A9|nr:hypothetical protein [Streptomyces atratus]
MPVPLLRSAISSSTLLKRLPPIGRLLPGLRALVLDADGLPCPPEADGELLLGGIGVARGPVLDGDSPALVDRVRPLLAARTGLRYGLPVTAALLRLPTGSRLLLAPGRWVRPCCRYRSASERTARMTFLSEGSLPLGYALTGFLLDRFGSWSTVLVFEVVLVCLAGYALIGRGLRTGPGTTQSSKTSGSADSGASDDQPLLSRPGIRTRVCPRPRRARSLPGRQGTPAGPPPCAGPSASSTTATASWSPYSEAATPSP